MSAAWVWFIAFDLMAILLVMALGGNANLAKENRRLQKSERESDRMAVKQARRIIALRQIATQRGTENDALRERLAEVERREPPYLSEIRTGRFESTGHGDPQIYRGLGGAS